MPRNPKLHTYSTGAPATDPHLPETGVRRWPSLLKLALFLLLFLLALELIQASFALMDEIPRRWLRLAENPFLSLFIGILATAIFQSSSTITTLIVAALAGSAGSSMELPFASAVYMVMGANIGTSVTSTIVALGLIGDREEFRKAVAAASLHGFFNIITVVVLFVLEYSTGSLSAMAEGFAAWIVGPSGWGMEVGEWLAFTIRPLADLLLSFTAWEGWPQGTPYISLPISFGLLFIALQGLIRQLKSLIIGKTQLAFTRVAFDHPVKSLFWGVGITAGIQSSSLTTSLMVPLVASDKINLQQAFPFLMGANIGTTATALLAAFILGSQSLPALSIAFVHFFFNLFGVLLLFPISRIRELPIRLAERLGDLTLQNRLIGVGYIVGIFFLLPGMFILFTQ